MNRAHSLFVVVSAVVALSSCGKPSIEGGACTSPEGGACTSPDGGACTSPLAWSRVPGSPGGFRIMGSGPRDLWLLRLATGDGETFGKSGPPMHGDGTTFSPVPEAGDDATASLALWVAAPGKVFLGLFKEAVLLLDASKWTSYSVQANRSVDSFWGFGSEEIWGARSTGSYLGRWTGSTWEPVSVLFNGGVLVGAGAEDFWSVDEGGELADSGYIDSVGFGFLHHDPSGALDRIVTSSSLPCAPQPMPDGSSPVQAGWASATDDVWYVGRILTADGGLAGVAFHYDGATWQCSPIPTTATLLGVWGTSRRDVWAVGERGTILHFDGERWSSIASPTTQTLYSVWASGPCDVWAIGDAVYHAE